MARPFETIVSAFRALSDQRANLYRIPIEELPASVDEIKEAFREFVRARFLDGTLTEDLRNVVIAYYVRLGQVVTQLESLTFDTAVANEAIRRKSIGKPAGSRGRLRRDRPPLADQVREWARAASREASLRRQHRKEPPWPVQRPGLDGMTPEAMEAALHPRPPAFFSEEDRFGGLRLGQALRMAEAQKEIQDFLAQFPVQLPRQAARRELMLAQLRSVAGGASTKR
jgi:hypothetical protein